MTTSMLTARQRLRPHTPAQAHLRDLATDMHPLIVDYYPLELSLLPLRLDSHVDVAQDGLHLAALTGQNIDGLADAMTTFAQAHQPTPTPGARHPHQRIAETPYGFIYFDPTPTGTATLLTPWHATITNSPSLHHLLGYLSRDGDRYLDHWD